jgi:hypothetical protein
MKMKKMILSILAALLLMACAAAELVNINAGDYNIALVIPFDVENVTIDEPVVGETYGGTRYTFYSASVRPSIMYEEMSPDWVGESTRGEYVGIDIVVYEDRMKATQKNLREAAKETVPVDVEDVTITGSRVRYFDRVFAGIPGVLGVNEWTISDVLGVPMNIDCTHYKAVWWPDYDEDAGMGTVRCTISTQSKWTVTSDILNSVNFVRK